MRAFLLVLMLIAISSPAYAHMPDRPDLNAWFSSLSSKKGLCCSFADGVALADPDYGTEAVAAGDGTQVRYWVKLDGKKIAVPPEAVLDAPNRYGPAIVWPYRDADGQTQVRCFMPGAGA